MKGQVSYIQQMINLWSYGLVLLVKHWFSHLALPGCDAITHVGTVLPDLNFQGMVFNSVSSITCCSSSSWIGQCWSCTSHLVSVQMCNLLATDIYIFSNISSWQNLNYSSKHFHSNEQQKVILWQKKIQRKFGRSFLKCFFSSILRLSGGFSVLEHLLPLKCNTPTTSPAVPGECINL